MTVTKRLLRNRVLLSLLLAIALCGGFHATTGTGLSSGVSNGVLPVSGKATVPESENFVFSYFFHTLPAISDHTRDARTIRLLAGREKKQQDGTEKQIVSLHASKAPQGTPGKYAACVCAFCIAAGFLKQNVIISFMHDKDGMK